MGALLTGIVSLPFPTIWCRALDTPLVQVLCATKTVTISSLYLSALDFNLEVEDTLYLITIFLIHFADVEFLFEISCERWRGGCPAGYIFSPFSFC